MMDLQAGTGERFLKLSGWLYPVLCSLAEITEGLTRRGQSLFHNTGRFLNFAGAHIPAAGGIGGSDCPRGSHSGSGGRRQECHHRLRDHVSANDRPGSNECAVDDRLGADVLRPGGGTAETALVVLVNLDAVADPGADQCSNAYRNAPRTMPCGIVVPQRIVIDIRIPIPRLRALA